MESRIQPERSTATIPLRVLVVEDRPAYSYLINEMLTKHPTLRCEVTAVTSVAAVQEHLATRSPDAILLDLGLPDSFGFQTYSRVREIAPTTPIVIMTALDDEQLARRAVRQGAQDFLSKDDITPDLLARSITYSVERAREKAALRDLSASLLRVQDEERGRIAKALHEVTDQKLAAISIALAVVERGLYETPSDTRIALAECRTLLAACSSELQTMTCLLHAPLLDDLGLPGAARELADGFAVRSGIRVDLEISEDWPPLPESHALALFRILQEALENVLRHSHSRTASIRLITAAGGVRLEVEDSGIGLPPGMADGAGAEAASMIGVGILGMKERMRQLGGRLQIESPDGGTLVRATLPGNGGRT